MIKANKCFEKVATTVSEGFYLTFHLPMMLGFSGFSPVLLTSAGYHVQRIVVLCYSLRCVPRVEPTVCWAKPESRTLFSRLEVWRISSYACLACDPDGPRTHTWPTWKVGDLFQFVNGTNVLVFFCFHVRQTGIEPVFSTNYLCSAYQTEGLPAHYNRVLFLPIKLQVRRPDWTRTSICTTRCEEGSWTLIDRLMRPSSYQLLAPRNIFWAKSRHRTRDHLLTRKLLCHLSYSGLCTP